MEVFSWDNKYLTGHSELDRQHRQLFEILNTLHAAMKAREGNTAIDASLDELARYAEVHFTSEEQFMQEVGYPELEDHRQKHRQFAAQLNDLRRSRQAGKHIPTFEVLNFIGEWITDHVGRIDVKIGKYLRRPPQ